MADKTGKDFDQKFVKMMRIDHERDVNLFRAAASLPDKDVSAFAVRQLPVIQSHLDKIIALEKTME